MFFYFQFLSASLRTTVHAYNRIIIKNNIDDQEAQAPSIQFYQPIEMHSSGKIKGFVLKIVTSGPHLTFL